MVWMSPFFVFERPCGTAACHLFWHFRRVQVMLQADVLDSTLSVWLGTQVCLGRPCPGHARPIALLSSRYFGVRSQGLSPVLVMVADYLSM